MLRLLCKAALLSIATGATVAAVLFLPAPRNDYLDAIVDKQARLKSLPPGKVVLIGGSNVAFGLDTKQLESALGRPAVNMGLHGATGTPFALDTVRSEVERGDLYVVAAEYDTLFVRPESRRMLCRAALALPEPWKLLGAWDTARCYALTWADRFQLNSEWVIRRALGMKLRLGEDVTYDRAAFNEYGDMVGHLALRPTFDPRTLSKEPFGPVDEEVLEELHSFVSYAHGRGAMVLFTYPAYSRDAYAINRGSIDRLHRRLSEGLPVLGSPEDFVLDSADFYDTKYHLNATGRQRRTAKLIELLQRVVPSKD